MNAPITKPGNLDAAQQPRADERKPEDLGEGHVMGNLTADPKLRFTPTGRAVARLRIAYVPRFKDDATGTWKDAEPEFYDLNVWGSQGEHCAEFLQCGDRVVAAGTWTKRFWEDKDGNERASVELTVKDIGPSMLFRPAAIIRIKNDGGDDGRE